MSVKTRTTAITPAKTVCLIVALSVMVVGWLGWLRVGGWDDVLAWVWTTQQSLHRQLAAALHAVESGSAATVWSLLGLSLTYGVVHAAGPGHGKAVIATYLGTHAVQVRRGVLLSLLAALAQGLVAVVLVEAMEWAVTLFGVSLRRTQMLATQAENLSFALIVLLGAVLAARSVWALWRQRWRVRPCATTPLFTPPLNNTETPSGAPAMQPYCRDCESDCCHAHGPTRAQLNQPLSWRTSAAIVLAIGLRPCTGAVLVLLVAHALGLRWTALAAVFAMSLGTAATVAVLAALAVSARQGALRLLQRRAAPDWVGTTLSLLGVVGGCLIGAMGAGLLWQGLHANTHPLL